MKKSSSIFQNILEAEKKSLIKKSFQALFLICIIVICFYAVDFFDKRKEKYKSKNKLKI